MTSSIILTFLIIGLFAYSLSARKRIPVLSKFMFLLCFLGSFLAWRPDITTQFANFIGIGRGVDLLFYLFIIVSLFIFVNLHIKIKEQEYMLTQICRRIAINNPLHPNK